MATPEERIEQLAEALAGLSNVVKLMIAESNDLPTSTRNMLLDVLQRADAAADRARA